MKVRITPRPMAAFHHAVQRTLNVRPVRGRVVLHVICWLEFERNKRLAVIIKGALRHVHQILGKGGNKLLHAAVHRLNGKLASIRLNLVHVWVDGAQSNTALRCVSHPHPSNRLKQGSHRKNQGGIAVGCSRESIDDVTQLLLRPKLLEHDRVHDPRNEVENGLRFQISR